MRLLLLLRRARCVAAQEWRTRVALLRELLREIELRLLLRVREGELVEVLLLGLGAEAAWELRVLVRALVREVEAVLILLLEEEGLLFVVELGW